MARVATIGALLTLAGGCAGEAPPVPGVDGGGDVDAPSGTSSLTINWQVTPAVPGPLGSTHELDELRLRIQTLRVVGDDPLPPTRRNLDLRWVEMRTPTPVVFVDAPPAQYSQLEIDLDGGPDRDGYELSGVLLPDRDIEITDAEPMAITIPFPVQLDVGEAASATVTIDLAAVIGAVNWGSFTGEDEIKLDEESPENVAIRAAMQRAWSVSLPAGDPAPAD